MQNESYRFNEELAETFLKCKTPRKHVERILNVFSYYGHHNLPKTARKFLRAVQKAQIKSNNAVYFGIEKGILS
jgi:hypothetical protein